MTNALNRIAAQMGVCAWVALGALALAGCSSSGPSEADYEQAVKESRAWESGTTSGDEEAFDEEEATLAVESEVDEADEATEGETEAAEGETEAAEGEGEAAEADGSDEGEADATEGETAEGDGETSSADDAEAGDGD